MKNKKLFRQYNNQLNSDKKLDWRKCCGKRKKLHWNKWYDPRGISNKNSQIKLKTEMLKSSLHVYNNAYVLVKDT